MKQMKKMKKALKKGFTFSEMVKLAKQIISRLSKKHNCLFRIANAYNVKTIFFEKTSQNAEFVKSVCIDRNNLFHFACRR